MEDSGIDSGDHNGDNNPKTSQNGERIFTVRFLFNFFANNASEQCLRITLKIRLFLL